MKANDFLLCTFEGDTNTPATTYVAEITSVDTINSSFRCRMVDSDEEYTFNYSYNSSGPWDGSNDAGGSYSLNSHDLFSPARRDPAAGGVALVTFADGRQYLGLVDRTSPTTDVAFYHFPYPRISIDLDSAITSSDWDQYPTGTSIRSIEDCIFNDPSVAAAGGSGSTTAGGVFTDGWWSLATRRPAFAGRVGGAIRPFATVVHTTDMPAESMDGLVQRWTTELGKGNCSHFVIGRDAAHGVVQMIPVNRGGSHAGGEGHGAFEAGGQSWNPNSVAVGVELHCAGAVQQLSGQWRLVSDGQPSGAAIPDEDVIPDPQRPGRGWHRVTDYQYEQLNELLNGLETVLAPLPNGCVATSIEQPPAWGRFDNARVVGHVTLSASRRGDPWPPTCDWIRSRN